MCGISAIRRFDGREASVEAIHQMSSAISHRGPDGAGYARLDQRTLALGHVRLSVVDLEGGDQPLYNHDQSLCIVFNGEIYDHEAHRKLLRAEGFRFKTRSDTEVILYLYEKYGLSFVDHLNGEFAILIWDQKKGELIAVRDRSGIKPLFYRVDSSELLVASEIKAILALPHVPRRIDPDYVVGNLNGAFPKGTTAFEGIRSLKPGHLMVTSRRGVGPEVCYWKPIFNVDPKMTFEEAKFAVRETFTRAVERRMVADVPVGTYLSGGLDSTLVCGLMSQSASNFKAFNVGFGNSIFDEAPLAKRISAFYGARFETINCDNELIAQNFSRTIEHVEAALVNPSAIAKQILSGLVRRQGYKVCITGEGADEVFGGYPYFRAEALARRVQAGGPEAGHYRALAKRFKKMEASTEGVLWYGGKFAKSSNFHRARAAEAGKSLSFLYRPEILERASLSSPEAAFDRDLDATEMASLDSFNATRLSTFEQLSSYVIPTLGDRVEMANSVECRTPFLDRDLLELSFRIPPEHFMKLSELREKHLLRQAFQDVLPPFLDGVHKRPFLAPNWKRFSQTATGSQIMAQALSESSLSRVGIYQPRALKLFTRLWKVLPQSSLTFKRLDILMGQVMGVTELHRVLIDAPIRGSADFKMVDRSPARKSRVEEPLSEVSPLA